MTKHLANQFGSSLSPAPEGQSPAAIKDAPLRIRIRLKKGPTATFDLRALAREANFHPGSLYEKIGQPMWTVRRRVRAAHQMTVQELLTALKIEEAKNKLIEGLPTKSVAEELGYHDSSHFHNDFKRRTGLTPRQYVRSHAQA